MQRYTVSRPSRRVHPAVLLVIAFVAASCGGKPHSSSSSTESTPFANVYDGVLALRTADDNLSGDYANVHLEVGASGVVVGTVKDEVESSLARSGETRAIGSFTMSGHTEGNGGTFTANGSGNDPSGQAVQIHLAGTFKQLGTAQTVITSAVLTRASSSLTGNGTLPAQNAVAPPANTVLPPILTGTLKIPQGVTVRFIPTGSDAPANPDEKETGDVVNFSIANYHSPGFDGYSNIDSGGWSFHYDGTYITISVPNDAPITTGYEVRDRSTGTAHSANFEVVACPLVQYTGSNIVGTATIDEDFRPTMDAINAVAGTAGVKVAITNSFRTAGQTLQGTVVPPAGRSNHLVGHAIDMNVQYTNANGTGTSLCNSGCLAGANPPAAVASFIAGVKAEGVRYGGDFVPTDVVHFDDHYNADDAAWISRYGVLQQCAANMGL